MDRSEIYDTLAGAIARLTGQTGAVTADVRLADLGLDSLAVIELVFELEERYDINLPFNSNDFAQDGNATLGTLVEMVIATQGAPSAA